MNTHDKIELPLMPAYETGFMGREAINTMRNYARAAIEPYAKRIAQLEAARFAYASEFPPNKDGDPDVGSIHENIRKLKAEVVADRKRTTKQLAACESLVASLEAKCTHMRKMYDELKASTNPDLLASERAANAILTAELEANRKRGGEPVAPEGFRLIAVNETFDSLTFWLDRCEQKGHLENCADLVEPWEAFEYREVEAPQPAEPVKEPSAAEMAKLWDEAHNPFGPEPFLMSHIEYSRTLLARYGQPTPSTEADELSVAYFCGLADGKKSTNTLPAPKPDPWYEEGTTDVFDHAQRQAYVDGWNECLEAMSKGDRG